MVGLVESSKLKPGDLVCLFRFFLINHYIPRLVLIRIHILFWMLYQQSKCTIHESYDFKIYKIDMIQELKQWK